MAFFHRIHKILAMPMIFGLIICTIAAPALSAENVGTDTLIHESTLSADRSLVYDFMAREEVQQEMSAMGVDPNEAFNRLDSLSDSEVQQIAGKINTMPAGQGGLGTVVGAALTVFVILLITDILCLTNFFNFTTCAR